MTFKRSGDVLELQVPARGSSLGIGGQLVKDSCRITDAQLEAGVVLMLARRIVLLLHYQHDTAVATDSCDFVGESDPVQRIRKLIVRVAGTEVPVLLLGESGTGKELAAPARTPSACFPATSRPPLQGREAPAQRGEAERRPETRA